MRRRHSVVSASASPAFWQQVAATERDYLAQARALDVTQLAPAARVTYDIFVGERELALEQLAFREYLMPVDQMGWTQLAHAIFNTQEFIHYR